MKEFPELPHSIYDRPIPDVELCIGALARVFAISKGRPLSLPDIYFFVFKRLGVKQEPSRTPNTLYYGDNINILYDNIHEALDSLKFVSIIGVISETKRDKIVKKYFLTNAGRMILEHEPYVDNSVIEKYMALDIKAKKRKIEFEKFLYGYFKGIETSKTNKDV